jgi:hypothetical protein
LLDNIDVSSYAADFTSEYPAEFFLQGSNNGRHAKAPTGPAVFLVAS